MTTQKSIKLRYGSPFKMSALIKKNFKPFLFYYRKTVICFTEYPIIIFLK